MTGSDIARLRLHNQRIAYATAEKPGDVVAWLGAVQAQDYLEALWAVGLRMRNAVEADVERCAYRKSNPTFRRLHLQDLPLILLTHF